MTLVFLTPLWQVRSKFCQLTFPYPVFISFHFSLFVESLGFYFILALIEST